MACASPAYLNALGIDVWVRRELLASRSRVRESAPSGKPESGPITGRETVSNRPAGARSGQPVEASLRAPAVEFAIRCVRFGRVLALIDEPLWRDSRERRFLLDVARAMHGPGRVERESRRFEWPQLRSADAGMDAARRAFRAYLETQIVKDTRVLAAGGRVRELIAADVEGHIDLDRSPRGPTEKKALWRRIQELS